MRAQARAWLRAARDAVRAASPDAARAALRRRSVVWSAGGVVRKRYTAPAPVLQARARARFTRARCAPGRRRAS